MGLSFLRYPGQQFVKLSVNQIWMSDALRMLFSQEGRSYSIMAKKTRVTKMDKELRSVISYLSGKQDYKSKTITRVLCDFPIISFSETHHPKAISF